MPTFFLCLGLLLRPLGGPGGALEAPKSPKTAYLALNTSNAPKKLNKAQSWLNNTGHIQGDVLGPFTGSEMAIGGRHRASKWPKMAKKGAFLAISRSGGSKMVDQCGSRLDQGRTHPGGCVGAIYHFGEYQHASSPARHHQKIISIASMKPWSRIAVW